MFTARISGYWRLIGTASLRYSCMVPSFVAAFCNKLDAC